MGAIEGLALGTDLSLPGLETVAGQLQQRGLARAVGPDDSGPPRGEMEIEAAPERFDGGRILERDFEEQQRHDGNLSVERKLRMGWSRQLRNGPVLEGEGGSGRPPHRTG